jgi:hypothetical protein
MFPLSCDNTYVCICDTVDGFTGSQYTENCCLTNVEDNSHCENAKMKISDYWSEILGSENRFFFSWNDVLESMYLKCLLIFFFQSPKKISSINVTVQK